MRDVFGYSYQALAKWNDKLKEIGADNGDRTYDLIKIIRWKCEEKKIGDTQDKANLEIQKLQKEIEYKAAQVEKVKENFVERALMNQIQVSRAASLTSFWEQAAAMNKHRFHMITADQALVVFLDIIKQGMEAYTGAEVDKSE